MHFIGSTDEYGVIGNGWCRAKCKNSIDVHKMCTVNGIRKELSDHEECKSACDSLSTCTGFAISDKFYSYPNRCYVYGNFSSWDKSKVSDEWEAYLNDGNMKIEGSNGGDSEVRCFQKLNELKPRNGEWLNILSYILQFSRKRSPEPFKF